MFRSIFLWSAEAVIRKYRRPMTPTELWTLSVSEGYIPDTFNGLTPTQTMKSKLSQEIRRQGESSKFVRTGPNRFYLRDLIRDGSAIYEAPRWSPPESKEFVTAFPSEFLDPRSERWFQGLRCDTELPVEVLEHQEVVHIARPIAELTEEYKQIITYIMVTRRGQVLSYRRGVHNHAAEMLKGSRCVGFGGHMSSEDWTLFDRGTEALLASARRELAEELKLPSVDVDRLRRGEGLRIVGVLNDDSSGVGRRHFAIVLQYEVSDDEAWAKPVAGELSITQLRWVGADSLGFGIDEYEYWSQLCLRELFPEIVRAQPSVGVRRPSKFVAPHVLCLVGEIGSGKTTLSEILVGTHGYVEVNTGQLVAGLIGVPPVPTTPREQFQRLAMEFVSRPGGCMELAGLILHELAEVEGERLLVDGIRQLDTLRYLKVLARGMRIATVYVHTTPDVAFEFYRSRERESASLREFLNVRDSPVEREVPLMIEEADAVLYNWLGRDELAAAVKDLIG